MMTSFDTNRPLAIGTTGSFFGGLFASLASWNDARITRNALGKLSDRELDDIGLCRADIETLTSDARR